MNIIIAASSTAGLMHILIGFLVIVAVLVVIWGLMLLIEAWFAPIPQPVKIVIAVVLLIVIIIWAIGAIGGGGTWP
jgi:hypothetical protein